MTDWIAELDLATRIAGEAGALTLRWFQRDAAIETKADGSPVTIADREAERLLRDRIAAAFPDDGILGEEQGETPGTSGRRWILDPIDGTKSFIHGVPLYGVMVALEADGEAVVGVLRFPPLGDTIAAASGMGCTWNGRPVRVSDVDRLDDALVLATGDGGPPDRVAGLRRVTERARLTRTWGDCYGYALVATGRAEAMLDPVLSPWDAAAVRPIIEEAGGVFTDWAGTPSHLNGSAIATNAAIARQLRRTLTIPTP